MIEKPIRRRKNAKPGLSGIDEPDFLVIGRLRKPHGLQDEWTLEPITDFPERIKKGRQVFLGDEKIPLKIKQVRGHIQKMLVTFAEDISNLNELLVRNQLIYVKTSELPNLPNGVFYQHQIIGMDVKDDSGESLGTISEILETGSNDVYIVKNGEKEILIPALQSTILKIDPKSRQMVVKLPEWI